METAAKVWTWITLKENQDALIGLVVFLTALTVAMGTFVAVVRAKIKGLIEDREDAASANLAMASSIEVGEVAARATLKTAMDDLDPDRNRLPVAVEEALKKLPAVVKRGVKSRMDSLNDGAKGFILESVAKVDKKRRSNMSNEELKKQMAEAQDLANKTLEWLKTQPLHILTAFLLAVTFGDNKAARDKALSQDADPQEEMWAWDQGLVWRPILMAWVLRQTGGIPGVPAIIELILRNLLGIQLEPAETP